MLDLLVYPNFFGQYTLLMEPCDTITGAGALAGFTLEENAGGQATCTFAARDAPAVATLAEVCLFILGN